MSGIILKRNQPFYGKSFENKVKSEERKYIKRIENGYGEGNEQSVTITRKVPGPYRSDTFYLNFGIPNTSVESVQILTQFDNRSSFILANPSDWEVTIIRFNIPTIYIPIFIFQPELYGITMTIDISGTTYTSGTYYLPLPSPTESSQNFPEQPQNYIMFHEDFINSINLGFLAAYNNLTAALPVGDHAEFTSHSTYPYMAMNPETQLITIYMPNGYLSDSATPTEIGYSPDGFAGQAGSGYGLINLFFNQALYSFFPNFQAIYNGVYPPYPANQYDYQILAKNRGINQGQMPNVVPYPLTTPPISEGAFAMTQAYDTLTNWTQFKSIAIISANLLTEPEYIASQSGMTQNLSKAILFDFNPSFDPSINNKSVLQYYPSGPLRWANMIQSLPLQSIDITIQWEDIFGNFYPIYIPYGAEADLKMCFRLKAPFRSREEVEIKDDTK